MDDLTPEEELEVKRQADAKIAASQAPSPQLALLQAQPGQVGGTNMLLDRPLGGAPLAERNAMLPNPASDDATGLPSNLAGEKDRAAGLAETSSAPPPVAAEPIAAGIPPASVEPTVRKPAKAAGGGGLPASPYAKTGEDAIAEGKQGLANEATQQAVDQKTNAAVTAATDEVKGKQEAQKILDQHAAAERTRREAIANQDKAYADFAAKRREEVQKKDLTGYWEDRSTGSKILSALAVGLGGFASGLTGGPNQALAIIQHSMAADAALKEKKLRAHLDSLGLDEKAYQHQLELARAEIGIDHEAMLGKLANDAEIRASKAKVPEAQANGAAMAASLKQEEAKQAQQNIDRRNDLVTKTVDYSLKRADLGMRGAEASANSKLKDAEIRHLDAESGLANAKAAGGGALAAPGGGRAASKMIDLAMSGAQQSDDLDVINREMAKAKNGVVLTADERNAMQSKATRLHAAEHDTSTTGALVTNGLRAIGAAPRSAIEDLTPGKQAYVQSVRLMSEKAAALIEKDKDGKERVQQLLDPTAAGISDAASRDRTEKLRTLGYVTNALAGKYGQEAQQAALQAREAGVGLDQMIQVGRGIAKSTGSDVSTRPQRSSADIARLNKIAQGGGPNAEAAKQLLRGGP